MNDTEYRELLERIVRRRVAIIKREIVKHLEKVKYIESANALYQAIRGTRCEVLSVWREMLRSGEAVKSVVGYSLPGIDKEVNDLFGKGVHSARLQRRRSVSKELQARFLKSLARVAMQATQENGK